MYRRREYEHFGVCPVNQDGLLRAWVPVDRSGLLAICDECHLAWTLEPRLDWDPTQARLSDSDPMLDPNVKIRKASSEEIQFYGVAHLVKGIST